jgi:tRNA1Val (adenine37-N6)-methyltransferase
MGNSVFKFKQFDIYQDKTAMKVGTDGVLLGSWVCLSNAATALDVGVGTGLICLMMAQRSEALFVTGVELDCDAFKQAKENILISKWSDRIKLENLSFQKFAESKSPQFDLIVTNPPFFVDSHLAASEARNLARHTNSLSYFDILKGANDLLLPTGRLSLILPFNNYESFCKEASLLGFYESRKLIVYPTPNKPAVRVLSEWVKHPVLNAEENSIIIETNGRHQYSLEYKKLTKEFYLKM